MGIARDDDVVANVVFVQSLKCSVSIRLVAILAIVQISVSRPPSQLRIEIDKAAMRSTEN